MTLTEQERSSILAKALDRRFGDLQNWRRDPVLHTFGPNNLDKVDAYEVKLAAYLNKFKEAIRQLPDSSLEEMSGQIAGSLVSSKDHWTSRIAKEIGAGSMRPPPYACYGFGHPKFQVDFDYWGKMSRITLNEASALSVGANPKYFDDKTIEALNAERRKKAKMWAAYEFFLNQRELLSGYFHFTGWGYSAMSLKQFKATIDNIELRVHPEFYATLERRFPAVEDKEPASVSNQMTSQERATLLKLIAAMACEQYGFDPSLQRSQAVSSIRDDLEAIGQTMDSKTIRKWLKEAMVCVDQQYWDVRK